MGGGEAIGGGDAAGVSDVAGVSDAAGVSHAAGARSAAAFASAHGKDGLSPLGEQSFGSRAGLRKEFAIVSRPSWQTEIALLRLSALRRRDQLAMIEVSVRSVVYMHV